MWQRSTIRVTGLSGVIIIIIIIIIIIAILDTAHIFGKC
jgi:hypothetical protein